MNSLAMHIKNKEVFTVSSVQKQGASKYKGLGKKTNENLNCMDRHKQAFNQCILKKALHTKSKPKEQCVIAYPKYGIGLPMGLLFCFINWIKES